MNLKQSKFLLQSWTRRVDVQHFFMLYARYILTLVYYKNTSFHVKLFMGFIILINMLSNPEPHRN